MSETIQPFAPVSATPFLLPAALPAEYRKLCYLRPVGAKNYLLDLICFERTPYQKSDFEFLGKDNDPTKEMITLWQEIEKVIG